MNNRKNEKLKKCNKQEVDTKEEIEDLKESYKLGKEYYKNVEEKIEKTRK